MDIDFIPPSQPSEDAVIEVHLGKILHGFIRKIENGNYCYFRIIAKTPIPRHETDNLEELMRMIKKVP